jgi:hypothetical protein
MDHARRKQEIHTKSLFENMRERENLGYVSLNDGEIDLKQAVVR